MNGPPATPPAPQVRHRRASLRSEGVLPCSACGPCGTPSTAIGTRWARGQHRDGGHVTRRTGCNGANCCTRGGGGRDALEGKAPPRQPPKPLGRRLEEVAKAVGGGYCRLQIPLRLALGVRRTVAGQRLGALEGAGATSPPSNASLWGGGGALEPPWTPKGLGAFLSGRRIGQFWAKKTEEAFPREGGQIMALRLPSTCCRGGVQEVSLPSEEAPTPRSRSLRPTNRRRLAANCRC